jgi:hypothetical protein
MIDHLADPGVPVVIAAADAAGVADTGVVGAELVAAVDLVYGLGRASESKGSGNAGRNSLDRLSPRDAYGELP